MPEIYYTPRWLHQQVKIAASSTVDFPAQILTNNELFPWRLEYISIAGDAETVGSGIWDDYYGGIARRLRVQIGTSQWGDINLVPSNGLALGATRGLVRQRYNNQSREPGIAIRFSNPVKIDASGGIVAECMNQSDFRGTIRGDAPEMAIMLHGYRRRKHGKEPAHIAGRANQDIPIGVSETLNRADLYNDGREDFYATDMIIDDGHAAVTVHRRDLTLYCWRVNPVTGLHWMPQYNMIPAGCIAPFNRAITDWWSQPPAVYSFPPNTILKHRQRISLKLTELSGEEQRFHVCLYGMLEAS